MWDLDLAFADVVASSSDPNLGAVRLAWWRERLEELDQGKLPPAEPRLQAVAGELVPQGASGLELSRLEDAWQPLLHGWNDSAVEGLRLRGRILFATGARLLGGQPADAEAAGELWSLVDGARHCSDESVRRSLMAEAKAIDLPRTVPRIVRPLTVLAAVAAPAISPENGRLAYAMAATRHRVIGRFPRGS